jgi:hypothetical protein
VGYPTERAALVAFLTELLARVADLGDSHADWSDYYNIDQALRHRVLAIGRGRIGPADAQHMVEQTVRQFVAPLQLRHRRHQLSRCRDVAGKLLDMLDDLVIDHPTGSSAIVRKSAESPEHSALCGGADIFRGLFGAEATRDRYCATLRMMRTAGLDLEYTIITKCVDCADAKGVPAIPVEDVAVQLRMQGIQVIADDVVRARRLFQTLMRQL